MRFRAEKRSDHNVSLLSVISLQEDEDVEWKELKAEIFATVMDFFATGIPVISENKAPSDTGINCRNQVHGILAHGIAPKNLYRAKTYSQFAVATYIVYIEGNNLK